MAAFTLNFDAIVKIIRLVLSILPEIIACVQELKHMDDEDNQPQEDEQ